MRSPLQRIRRGAIFLSVITLIALVGYRLVGYDWLGSIWMVVVTLSSVGYGEQSQLSVWAQMLTIFFIVFGFTGAVYTVGGFIQLLTEGEIERVLGLRRMTRDINRLNDHVVVCGFGRVGRVLAESMSHHQRSFIVIEKEDDRAAEAKEHGYLCLTGDATEDFILLAAGIERAGTLVTSLPNDAANVFITLTSRNLNPKLKIISRAEHASTEKKLLQAGADRVVLPTIISARRMERMITRPSTADLMETLVEGRNMKFALDELVVRDGNSLVGTTVQQTEAHRKHQLLVVAVKQPDGEIVFNPNADYVFKPDDVLMLMGQAADISRFREEFNL